MKNNQLKKHTMKTQIITPAAQRQINAIARTNFNKKAIATQQNKPEAPAANEPTGKLNWRGPGKAGVS